MRYKVQILSSEGKVIAEDQGKFIGGVNVGAIKFPEVKAEGMATHFCLIDKDGNEFKGPLSCAVDVGVSMTVNFDAVSLKLK